MSRLVCNSSPLIVLAKAGLLEILPKLSPIVFVPQAVQQEIMAGPADDPMRLAWGDCGWLRVVVLDPPLSPLAALQLGRGEAEVIECGRRQDDCAVLLDDRAGRRAALGLGLRVLGTLSVVAIAVQAGHVDSFDDAAGRLRAAGLYASDALVDEVRRGLRTKH